MSGSVFFSLLHLAVKVKAKFEKEREKEGNKLKRLSTFQQSATKIHEAEYV